MTERKKAPPLRDALLQHRFSDQSVSVQFIVVIVRDHRKRDNVLINEISWQLITSRKGYQSGFLKVIKLIGISVLFYFCGFFVVFQNTSFER